jgi:hypothetical protein
MFFNSDAKIQYFFQLEVEKWKKSFIFFYNFGYQGNYVSHGLVIFSF